MLVFPVFLFSAACGGDGKDGASCTVVDNMDGTYSIICDDGTSATFSDGQDGQDGEDGEDGDSPDPCTAVDNGDGTYTIECPDGTSFTLSDGQDGEDGDSPEPCTATDNGDGTYTIECPDGTSVTLSDGEDGAPGQDGAPGEDGEPCTIIDNGDGTFTINCPDGTSVTLQATMIPGNSACAGAHEIPIQDVYVLAGTNEGATANYLGTEAGGDNRGPAVWYHFTLERSAEVTLTLDPDGWDGYVYLLSGDCDGYTQIADHEELIEMEIGMGEYLVVVTGLVPGEYGTFDLTAEFELGEAVVVYWSFEGETADPDLGEGEITPGSGLTGPTWPVGYQSTDAMSFSNWGLDPNDIDDNRYVQFWANMTGFQDFGFSFWGNRSGTGPLKFMLYYSTDGIDFDPVPDSLTDIPTDGWEHYSFDLSGLGVHDAAIWIRVYGFNAGGTWRFDDVTFTGYEL